MKSAMKPAAGLRLIAPLLAALILALGLQPALAQGSKQDLWRAVAAGEAFVMIRHAIAPGYGDPDNFTIGDCSTQRNLSDEGRDQARQIGRRFRDNGVQTARVYTSQWCRCRETAKLLGFSAIRELPALNSLHARRERTETQVTALKKFLAERADTEPLILVSHHATIGAFTGSYPSSGGMVVARLEDSGDVTVLGQL